MYSSRGGNAYGQQSFAAAQQAYGQNAIGAEGSRHSLLGGSQDADNYRAAAAQYGGQYGSVYGSSTLSSIQQAGAMSGKVAGSLPSGDYVSSSSHGYGQKGDQFSGKIPDYPSLERRNYGDHQSAYIGRDLQSEPARRYAESTGLAPQHQAEIYDHIDQASLLRQQQILKSQALQSASLDGSARPADYLAARSAAMRHANPDLASYGGRMDAEPRNLSILGGSSYGQHQASILGAAPRRNVEDLMYVQGSSTAGYGVSLPPGRDYAAGKGLRGASLENDYPGGLLSRGGHPSAGGPRIDERKDDRGGFRRDLEIRDEERRRREREKEREREKDRERERERKRERERRDKEKERERKRGPDIRREPTPPRLARDRHGSSLLKDERSVRRDSPRHDALHRRRSPVREKRREYVCKVHPSSLVEVERDYLSIIKRYPNLSISPEFSKVVTNWPKGNLQLSIHTPVSFEHDVIDLESRAEQKKPSSKPLSEESGQSRVGSVVWNAKVILLSGLSNNALEDLSSDKSFDDRIPHINNILRFAFLRKDRSFMAIGGQWDVVDGGDPSIDDSSLVQTALRHVKDLVQLDLRTCQKWNRFLEIHYDRVGSDGLFSHKEITVLFIPDLSDCLPSLSSWRDQWLAHRKCMIEKERLISLKTEKSAEKHAVVKKEQSKTKSDKDVESPKIVKIEGKPLKKEKEPHGKLSDQPVDKKTKEEGGSEVQDNEAEKEKVKDEVEGGVDKKGTETVPSSTEIQKPGKRKLVKRVLKQKVVDKKAAGENSMSKGNEKLDEKKVDDKQDQAEASGQQNEVTVEPSSAKTSLRKKIVKKVPVGKSAKKENKGSNSDGIQIEGTPGKDLEDKLKDKVDTESAVTPESGVKTTTKKKIIKRVPKKKAVDMEGKGATADNTKDVDKDEDGHETEKTKKQTEDGGTPALGLKKTEKKDSSKTKVMKLEKEDDGASKTEKEIKDGKGKEGKGTTDKTDSGTKKDTEAAKGKGPNKDSHDDKKEITKDEKDKKDGKDESRQKLSKETKEKVKSDEPPLHPGFILQAKRTKESKIRSMSLSLDSLLDYNDKDIEESTFELSLFAESMYEMLQYQMGCRLLAFLQNLRLNFVKKRNERKRQREENPKTESEKENSRKRMKTNDEPPKENKSAKSDVPDAANEDEKQNVGKEESCADEIDDSKMDNESDDYDPEEVVDEDQEMDDASNDNNESEEVENEDEVTDTEAEPEKEITEQKDETKVVAETEGKSNVEEAKDKAAEVESKEKAKPAVKELTVNKELMQAFRFFDRNRVGYIKVEDMRYILHNLGQFLSHRDVKELVQSALLESNTARDNRILYNKLVRS